MIDCFEIYFFMRSSHSGGGCAPTSTHTLSCQPPCGFIRRQGSASSPAPITFPISGRAQHSRWSGFQRTHDPQCPSMSTRCLPAAGHLAPAYKRLKLPGPSELGIPPTISPHQTASDGIRVPPPGLTASGVSHLLASRLQASTDARLPAIPRPPALLLPPMGQRGPTSRHAQARRQTCTTHRPAGGVPVLSRCGSSAVCHLPAAHPSCSLALAPPSAQYAPLVQRHAAVWHQVPSGAHLAAANSSRVPVYWRLDFAADVDAGGQARMFVSQPVMASRQDTTGTFAISLSTELTGLTPRLGHDFRRLR